MCMEIWDILGKNFPSIKKVLVPISRALKLSFLHFLLQHPPIQIRLVLNLVRIVLEVEVRRVVDKLIAMIFLVGLR